jgi:hypothetical protein
MKGERRYRSSRFGQRSKDPGEQAWGRSTGGGLGRRAVWIAFGAMGLLFAAGLVWVWSETDPAPPSSRAAAGAAGEGRDEVEEALDAATRVARAFVTETDPEQRLRWVRQAEAVRPRIDAYPAAARDVPGEIERVIGHANGTTAFVVALPSGERRLLEMVTTPEGPRVDWDAYARYGSESWEDLWSGAAQTAVVRTFCEPSTEAPAPFDDRAQWTAFRMDGPDFGQVLLGFAATGSVRERKMREIILGSPKYRQRFVLRIRRHEGKHEPLFEILECLAVGWIEGARPVEEIWAEPASDAPR